MLTSPGSQFKHILNNARFIPRTHDRPLYRLRLRGTEDEDPPRIETDKKVVLVAGKKYSLFGEAPG